MSQTERNSAASVSQGPTRRVVLVAAAVPAALAAGLVGQWALDRWPAAPWGWVLLVAGAGTFAAAVRRYGLEGAPARAQAAARPRLAWLAAALGLAALAFAGFSGNLFRPLPTLAWLLSLVLCYGAFAGKGRGGEELPRCGGGAVAAPPLAQGRPSELGGETPRAGGRDEAPVRGRGGETPPLRGCEGLHLSWHALALVGILVVAAFLRLYQLDAIPREMGTDMPHNYQNALQIMSGQFMIFCPSYPGRESLFFYLLAGYSKVFGLSYFSIKFTSAMVGLATVAALYGVATYLFDREVGLAAAALLAVSKWHVILSRTGYRASLMPLAVLVVLFLLLRALRRGRASDWVLAGMALGLGLYTYNAFMIVPGAVAAALAIEVAREGRGALRRRGWGLVGLAVGAMLVFLPLGRYALEQPQSYLFRVATRVTSVERPLPADLAGVLAGNLWRAAGMFNLRGDEVALSNVPYQRELGAVSAVFFVAGLGYALARWRRGHYALALVFLGSLMLPTALSVAFPREVPNAVRASGAIVPVYLLAALPLALLRRSLAFLGKPVTAQETAGTSGAVWWSPTRPRAERWRALVRRSMGAGVPAIALVVVLLGAELAETRHAYFDEYVAHLPGRNYAISLEIARVLDDFAPEGQAFVKIWPYWFDGNALRAQLKVMSKSWDWEVPELDPNKPPLATARGKLLFIVHPDDRATLEMLAAEFPGGVAINHRDYNGQVAFVTFYGER